MNSVLEFKGKMLSALVLILYTDSISEIESCISQNKSKWKIFSGEPVILDLSRLTGKNIDFLSLKKMITTFFSVIGVCSSDLKHIENSMVIGWAEIKSVVDLKNNNNKNIEDYSSIMIDKQLRSGQRIYAVGRDVVCFSQVSSGAEIISDGNIHIHSSLRGRALAGANGNRKSIIFAYNFGPELVSIAGVYKIFEDGVPESLMNKEVIVKLNSYNNLDIVVV